LIAHLNFIGLLSEHVAHSSQAAWSKSELLLFLQTIH